MNYRKHLTDGNVLPRELVTKDGDVKARFRSVIYDISNDIDTNRKEEIYHLKYWTGSKKHMTLLDSEHYRMIDVLNVLGIKYTLGNDAPRGGATGDYIKVKYDGRNKYVKAFRKAFSEAR